MDLAGLSPDRNQGYQPIMRLRPVYVDGQARPDFYNMIMGRGTRQEVVQARLMLAYLYAVSYIFTWPAGRHIMIPIAILGSWIPVRHAKLNDGFDEAVVDWTKQGLRAAIRYTKTNLESFNIRLQEAVNGVGAQYLRRIKRGYNISRNTEKLASYIIAHSGKTTVCAIDAFKLYASLLTGYMAIDCNKDGILIGLTKEKTIHIAKKRCHDKWMERARSRFNKPQKRATAIWSDRMKLLDKITQGHRLTNGEALTVLADHAVIMGETISIGNYRLAPHSNTKDDLMTLLNSFDIGAYFCGKERPRRDPLFGHPLYYDQEWEQWVPDDEYQSD